MIPELYWIQPITWLIGIVCTAIFAYYIAITERFSGYIWLTMLGQFVVIAGKTMADYWLFVKMNTTPLLPGAVMLLGGFILLAANYIAYSEVNEEE